jgi:polysaccharide export outer membrane protein
MNPSDPTNLINRSNPPSKVITMKKLLYFLIFFILFFPFNPINLFYLFNETNQIDQINETNQIDEIDQIDQTDQINQINQNAYAQNSKKQPGAGRVHPAPAISKRPNEIFSFGDEVLSFEVHEDYVIGKGDLLRVFVWRNDQLSDEVVVRPDGRISLPLLQDLQAAGLTVLQLKKEITRRFNEYINNPKVTVIVSQINSYKVSVLGRVVRPGVYPITGNTTFIEAISMAGGFTEWANKRKITVITHQGGKKKKIRVNYNKIISGKDPGQNIILKRGDTIIVP